MPLLRLVSLMLASLLLAALSALSPGAASPGISATNQSLERDIGGRADAARGPQPGLARVGAHRIAFATRQPELGHIQGQSIPETGQ